MTSSESRPAESHRTPVLLGVWFGLLAGLGEGIYVLLKGRVLMEPVGGYPEANAAVIWTAPLAAAATFALFGLLLAGIGSVWRRFPAALVGTALFTGLLALSWLMVPGHVPAWVGAVFSLGVAIQVTRMAKPRMAEFAPYVRRSIPRGLLLVAGLVVVQLAVPRFEVWQHARTAPRPTAEPNVLLIVLDTERADRLSLYGYGLPTTPELSRLARSAITFEQAFSPSGWTFPSHASLFTGRMYPGVRLGARFRNPLQERETTLAEVLRDAGYGTAAFTANMLYVNPQLGLGQGFLEWSGLRVSPRSAWLSSWLNRGLAKSSRRVRGAHQNLFLRDADDINGDFLGWLDDRPGDRPFFAFLNYFDPHSPYGAPAPFAGMFRDDDRPIWLTKGTNARPYTEEERAELGAAYDEEVAYLDSRIGSLFDALADRQLLENTLVIITSDHGEQFGEHGLMDHGQDVYSSLTRVPLLIRLPSGEHGGLHVREQVGTIDVAATVLDVVGLSARAVGGRTLAPLWTGVEEARPVYSYHDGYGVGMRSVHQGGWHFIDNLSKPDELYYLPDDPGEQNNLAATASPSLLAELRSALAVAFGPTEGTRYADAGS